jgi:hypothetical protein
MNRKIAAVLLAATMLTAPAFAASVVSSPDKPAAQAVTPNKVTNTSDKSVKTHRIHARVSHAHKVQHAKHTKPSQMNHANKDSKNNLPSASKKGDTKAVAAAPTKGPVKN